MGVKSNVAIALVAFCWWVSRIQDVGWFDAFAELLGVAQFSFYKKWRDAYTPLHAELFQGVLRKEWLDDRILRFLDALNKTSIGEFHQIVKSSKQVLRFEGLGVVSFPLLTPAFCQMIIEELAYFEASGRKTGRPNSMNDYGSVLAEIGLDDLAIQLRHTVLTPLALALYRSPSVAMPALSGNASIDAAVQSFIVEAAAAAIDIENCCHDHHAFTIRYSPLEQAELDMHHDDADVTLNVCLGATVGSQKSGMRFCGFVGQRAHRQYKFTVEHQVGHAIIHLGSHRHGTNTITSGERQNLIIWGRSQYRRDSHTSGHPSRTRLHSREMPPDMECLSWTHDADFTEYRELPPEAVKKLQEKKDMEYLMKIVRTATEEEIARLPEDHQAMVMLMRAFLSDENAR